MEEIKKDPELDKLIEDMLKKQNNVTSDDGKVTLHFTGGGDYTSVDINCFLEETTKEELEKDFISVLEKSKAIFSAELADNIIGYIKHKEEKEEQEDEYGVTIDNVS